jgi:hypothetical protein
VISSVRAQPDPEANFHLRLPPSVLSFVSQHGGAAFCARGHEVSDATGRWRSVGNEPFRCNGSLSVNGRQQDQRAMRFLRRPTLAGVDLQCEGLSRAPHSIVRSSHLVPAKSANRRHLEGRGGPRPRQCARSGSHNESAMTTAAGERRLASPVRLTLSSQLGHDIDGAWWLRTGRIAQELPELVAVLGRRLGEIIDIKVNWSSLDSPPNLNLPSWFGKRQHVITINGRNACAKLLIVPDRTGTPLALMVLRQAAGLPIRSAHRDTQAFRTADCVVRAARTQHEQLPLRLTRARRAT